MDYTRPVRRAVLPALKASPALTALIPVASLYPSTVPATRTFPFGRYGAPQTVPFRASGLSSSQHRFTYYAYTKPFYVGGDPKGALLDSAESQAERMAAAIQAALDGRVLTIEGGMRVTLTWLGTNCLQDPTEADAWQANVSFLAEVAG